MAKKVKPPPSELKSHIGYHLRVISNAVSYTFAAKLVTSGVTVAEWVILREMYSSNDQTSPSAIAKLTGLTRGAVSKLIERLLNKRLVTRIEDQDDRRYQQIQLTPAAIRLIPKLASIADRNDGDFFAPLSETEKRNLLATLIKLMNYHKLYTSPIK